MATRGYPLLRIATPLGKNRVRLFFGINKQVTIIEARLPWIRNAEDVRIVDYGMGLALGDGRDVSAISLWELPDSKLIFGKKYQLRRV